jgi:hypothetical protein
MNTRKLTTFLWYMLLTACSAGTSNDGDEPTAELLNAKSATWLGSTDGKTLVFYSYESGEGLIDVRASPKAGTEAQYKTRHTGTAATGYAITLEAVNVSRTFPSWGRGKTLQCSVGSANTEFKCGPTTFRQAAVTDITQ